MTRSIIFLFPRNSTRSWFYSFLILYSFLPASLLASAASLDHSTTTQASTPSEKTIDLLPGKAVERELAGAETHTYRVAPGTGQSMDVMVEQRGVDVVIQVLENSNVIAEINSEARLQKPEHFVLTADTASAYELRIKAKYQKLADGKYEIKVSEPHPSTEQERSTFTAYKLITQADNLSDSGKYDEAIKVGQQALESGKKGLE